jgi:hypothetical protein
MTTIKTQHTNRVFRRIHDGFIMGNEIVLGKDYSTGIEREDLPEYYEEVLSPDAPTPPTPTNKGVIIPEKYSWVFTNNRFELNNFVVEFQTVNNELVVDTSYIFWEAFKNELDKLENITVKDSLMPVWDYVIQQIIIDNTIDL